MIYFQMRDGKRVMMPAYSRDGLHWKAYEVEQPVVNFWSDTNNNLLWDPDRSGTSST